MNELLGPNTFEEHLQDPGKVFEIVHPDDYEVLMEKKLGQLDFSKPILVLLRNHQGQYIWFEEYATPVYKNGQYVAIQGIIRNINEKIALQEQLEYKVSHDALTNIYNRAYYQSKANYFNEECDLPIAVIIADLDELKIINDNYGHQMGDHLIREAATLLKNVANEEAIVARIGGDEFAFLLVNVNITQVEQFIKKVHEEINQYNNESPLFTINLSMGYKFSMSSKGVMEQLQIEADRMMYKEKKAKKEVYA